MQGFLNFNGHSYQGDIQATAMIISVQRKQDTANIVISATSYKVKESTIVAR